MKTRIREDFKPTDQSYNNLRKHGAIPEFVDWELPNFIAYFLETGGEKKAWQMALQRWMRTAWKGSAGRAWEREREFNSSNRPYRKQPADVFQLTLGEMIADGLPAPEKIRRVYHKPNFEQPEAGPAMSPEEAFSQLRKIMK